MTSYNNILVSYSKPWAVQAAGQPFREGGREYAPGFASSALPKYAFNAKELDEETGMYYYEARYMNPPTFISRDPMFEKYFWMSPYAYCANNPVKYVDPSGMDWWIPDGESEPTWAENVNADNVSGGKYVGTTASWVDNDGCLNKGDEHGNITKTDLTVTVSGNKNTSGCFPIDNKNVDSYMKGAGMFGSSRGTRSHAGSDLYAPVGSSVYSVKDGIVVRDPYPFYKGTYAIEVNHGDFTARYCEIDVAQGLKGGTKVSMGQELGKVADMGLNNAMLHFEMYSNNTSGPLTDRNNMPYQRRGDLINPTPFLIQWKMK